MDFNFIQQNLLLVGLVVISGAMLALSFKRSPNGLSPANATLMINREDAVVIDVRAPGEFANGHIPQSRNIPADKIVERLGELEKVKGRPLILSCQSGMRTAGAAKALKAQGFDRVFTLDGGIAAWEQAGLPVKKGAK